MSTRIAVKEIDVYRHLIRSLEKIGYVVVKSESRITGQYTEMRKGDAVARLEFTVGQDP